MTIPGIFLKAWRRFIAGRVSTEAAPTAVKSPLDGFMKVIATHASHSRATCTDDAGRTTEEPFFQAVRVRHTGDWNRSERRLAAALAVLLDTDSKESKTLKVVGKTISDGAAFL